MKDTINSERMQTDLAELTSRARRGDQEALSALYEKTYSRVYYTVKSMIRDEDAVLDIVQDSYIKAFAHLGQFEGDDRFPAWVRQIAANTARDWLRKKRPALFTEMDPADASEMSFEEQIPDERTETLPEAMMDQEETKRLIREIIDELPEDQRAVIGMYYYEELSVKEIAQTMGTSESAVKSRLLYGRRKIEKQVRELEKKGTKLYGIAPLPFLLFLFRNMDANAKEIPNERILHKIQENASSVPSSSTTQSGSAINTTSPAGAASAGPASIGSASAVSVFAGLGAAKIGLIAVAALLIIGAAIGITKLDSAKKTKTVPPVINTAPAGSTVENKHESVPESESMPESASMTESRPMPEESSGPQTFRRNLDDGTYEITIMDENGRRIRYTRYFADDTIYRDETFRYDEYDRQTEIYEYKQHDDDTGTTEKRITYTYTLNDPTVVVEWKEIRDLKNSEYNPDGIYTGHAQYTYTMQDPANNMKMDLEQTRYIEDTMTVLLGRCCLIEYHEGQRVAKEWYDAGDANLLPETADTGNSVNLPTDGDRTVLTGTVRTLSYEEVIALQGQPDPNAPYTDKSRTYRLIILDGETEVTGHSGDGLYTQTGTPYAILIDRADVPSSYDGQYITFSISPDTLWWPSDTRLPLGQPGTSDIHILD